MILIENATIVNEGQSFKGHIAISEGRIKKIFEGFDALPFDKKASRVEAALAVHRDYVMAETLAIEWQVDQADLITLANDAGPLDDVLEFPHVAGPVVTQEQTHGIVTNGGPDRARKLGPVATQEVVA